MFYFEQIPGKSDRHKRFAGPYAVTAAIRLNMFYIVQNRDIRCNADAEIIGNKPCGNLILIDLKSHIRVLTDALK